MSLQERLLQDRSTVVDRWYRRVLKTYPADTARFLLQEPDRFQNPVGRTVAPALDELYGALVTGCKGPALDSPLDSIVRIRAVQDFAASEAVAFVLELKELVRERVADRPLPVQVEAELRDLDRRIDAAALRAFDIYAGCREQIHDIRARSLQRRTSLLLERTNRIAKGGSGR